MSDALSRMMRLTISEGAFWRAQQQPSEKSCLMATLANGPADPIRRRVASVLSILVLLGLVIGGSSAVAQSGAGSIQGTLKDGSGASIPDASVHVGETVLWYGRPAQKQPHQAL